MILFAVMIGKLASGQSADSLKSYLEAAARNNPAVKAAFYEYQASLQKVSQMGAYEDPQLSMGFFLEPMETFGGKQIAQFELMQMFPWFGTRKASRSEAAHMSKMAFEQFRETRDNLYLEIYTIWYSLCSLQQKLVNSEENKALLHQLEKLALRKFSSGSSAGGSRYSPPARSSEPAAANTSGGAMGGMDMEGSPAAQSAQPAGDMSSMGGSGNMTGSMGGSSSGMSEVLRIQLEIAELENNLESIHSEIRAQKARFNTLLNRPVGNEVIIPDTLSQIPFLLDTKAVMDLITTQNPMLGMIEEETLSYKAREEMNKKMSYPMFGIGLQYMLINKSTNDMVMPDMNGKDMIMPMVSLSIPIFRGKYKASKQEAQFLQQASGKKYTDAIRKLEAELCQSKHQLDDATRKVTLYRKQIGLTRTIYYLVVREFASGRSDLGSVIQIQRQLLDYQLKKSEAIANYNTAVAVVQKLISSGDSDLYEIPNN